MAAIHALVTSFWERPMDGMVLGFFLLAAFLGAVTTGVAGFAMGLVVSGIWLHILTPVQTVSLMVSYSVLLQGYSIWKLRHALSWRKIAPFIISSAIGVPIGAMLLAHINPAHLRTGVGLVLLLYSIYYLARPVIIATSAVTAAWLGASGAVTADTVKLFLLGLPMLLAGTWVGMKLYGRLDEAAFRRVVLILLLISGMFLVVPVSSFG